jgi:hypothetical protein
MRETLGETEGDVTQQVGLAGAETVAEAAPRRDRLLWAARVCAVAGLAFVAVSVLCWGLTRASSGGQLPPWALRQAYWWTISLAGLVGFWLAAAGLVLGIAYAVAARRRSRHTPWGQFTILVSVVALLATGGSAWLLRQPAYFLGASLPQTHATLDALSPRDVVRAYLTSQDLSVEYWLSDAEGRALWREPNSEQDLNLLAGVSDLRITPLPGQSDAARRSFSVSYVTRAGEMIGTPAGPRDFVAVLVRPPGASWRVSDIGPGL